jgi:hypothetical protein
LLSVGYILYGPAPWSGVLYSQVSNTGPNTRPVHATRGGKTGAEAHKPHQTHNNPRPQPLQSRPNKNKHTTQRATRQLRPAQSSTSQRKTAPSRKTTKPSTAKHTTHETARLCYFVCVFVLFLFFHVLMFVIVFSSVFLFVVVVCLELQSIIRH